MCQKTYERVTASKTVTKLPRACRDFCRRWACRLNAAEFPESADEARVRGRRAIIALFAMDSGLGIPAPFDARSELRALISKLSELGAAGSRSCIELAADAVSASESLS